MTKQFARSRTEDIFPLQYIFVNIEDDVTVDVTTIIATTIDITFYQTGVFIHRTVCYSDEVIFRNRPFCRIPLKGITNFRQLIVCVSCICRLRTISNELG